MMIGESELTQLKNNYSRKKKTNRSVKAESKTESVRLKSENTAPFFSAVGENCGFYANPRKKQLRKNRFYAII